MIAGLAKGELHHFDPRQITTQSLGAFVYLVLIGGIIGYVSYAWLLRHCEPSKVATYAYVNPIVAVLLGTVFAGETLTLRTTARRGIDYRLGRGCNHGATDENERFSRLPQSSNRPSARDDERQPRRKIGRSPRDDRSGHAQLARGSGNGASLSRPGRDARRMKNAKAFSFGWPKRRNVTRSVGRRNCATWARNRPSSRIRCGADSIAGGIRIAGDRHRHSPDGSGRRKTRSGVPRSARSRAGRRRRRAGFLARKRAGRKSARARPECDGSGRSAREARSTRF